MKKLVLTGAAGSLGSRLREPLARMCDELVSTDQVEALEGLAENERYVKADLADLGAMVDLLEGADMVVHFGAIPDEAPFEELLGPNFIGAYTVWEAAHRNGVRRVIYARPRSMRLACIPKRNSSARMSRTGPTRSMVCQSALPRTLAGCTGRNAGSRRFACAS